MSWRREDHKTQVHGAALGNGMAIIDIGPKAAIVRRPPVPEQDARQMARRQRNHAGVYAQREVLAALAHAQGAIEPKESPLERAMRWLREWRASL
jgi:hypothetical protein